MAGKDKLRKFAEMSTFSNVVEPATQEVLNKDYQLKGNWSKLIFKNENPIVLELGCGKGEYTVGLAQEYPEKNFIGIDIKGARMWKGAKFALEEELKNVFFLRTRIDFITSCFGQNEVDQIWITFPDPQLKESREKKRLTHPNFLERYRSLMKEDGIVNLKTDSYEFYSYTLEVVKEMGVEILESTSDLYANGIKFANDEDVKRILSIRTFYETMFLKEGKKICYLKFKINGSN